ncbi:hypothetical protein [Micromonospora sp. IBHARD004]|uniref:hypothetical protein n=1 Tax=Micromonospora sp. IBHARD004 TaxID=3457764 RepID=UPI0040599F21
MAQDIRALGHGVDLVDAVDLRQFRGKLGVSERATLVLPGQRVDVAPLVSG